MMVEFRQAHNKQVTLGKFFLLGALSLVMSASLVMAVFTPFVVAMAFVLYGRKLGWLLGLLGTVVSFALFKVQVVENYSLLGPEAVFLYVLTFIVGAIVGEIVLRKIRPVKGLVVSGGLLFVALFGSLAVIFSQLHHHVKLPLDRPEVQSSLTLTRNVKAYTLYSLENMNLALEKEKAKFLADGGEQARFALDYLARPELIIEDVLYGVPTFLFIGTFFWIWLSLYMVLKVHRIYLIGPRRGHTEKDLLTFKVPENVIWAVVLVLLLTVGGDYLSLGNWSRVGESLLHCFGIFYFFQGLGIFMEFLDYIRLQGLLRSFLVVFTVISGWWIIASVGLFDMWVNFRKFFNRDHKNKGEPI